MYAHWLPGTTGDSERCLPDPSRDKRLAKAAVAVQANAFLEALQIIRLGLGRVVHRVANRVTQGASIDTLRTARGIGEGKRGAAVSNFGG